MSRWLRRAAVLLAASAVSVGGLQVASAPTASAATKLGGVNLYHFCKSQIITRDSTVRVYTVSPHNAYSWRCSFRTTTNNAPQIVGFNMNYICNWTYRGGAWAKTSEPSSPTSWRCYR